MKTTFAGTRFFVWPLLALLFLSVWVSAASNSLGVNAGRIYHVDLYVESAPQYWVAFYGTATPTGRAQQSSLISEPYNRSDRFAIAPRVHFIPARYAPSCLTTADWLFISTNDTVDWSGWRLASLDHLNAVVGVPNGSIEDAGQFFLTNGSLSLSGKSYSNVTWLRLVHNESRFDEYVLRDPAGTVVFAIPLIFPAVRGFNDTLVNYEAFLPRGPSYSFLHNPGFCVPAARSAPVTLPASSKQLVKEKTADRKAPAKADGPARSPKKPDVPAAAKTVTIVQSSNTAVSAQISESQTVISATYSFTESGTQTLQITYPIPSSYLETGRASVELTKMTDQGHRIETKADSSSQLSFASAPEYRFFQKGNLTTVVWVIHVDAGDVYVARATVAEALPPDSIQLTRVEIERGDVTARIFPTARPPSRLKVEVYPAFSTGLHLLAAVVAAAVLLAAAFIWRRPWIRHYLGTSQRGYLFHFFIFSRKNRH